MIIMYTLQEQNIKFFEHRIYIGFYNSGAQLKQLFMASCRKLHYETEFFIKENKTNLQAEFSSRSIIQITVEWKYL